MAQPSIEYVVRDLVGDIAYDGAALRDKLLAHLARGEHVTLDFANLRVVFPLFMQVAIGDLMQTYDPETVRGHIRFVNLPFAHEDSLRFYIENAYRYHHDRHYRWAIDEANRITYEEMMDGDYDLS